MSALPIIDISPLFSKDVEAMRAVAKQLDEACCQWGFFYIVGHGIPTSRIEELTVMANRLWALPKEEKLKIDITQSKHHRGYGGLAAEQLDPSKPLDYKETFDMGFHLDEDHPSVAAGRPLRGPNQHPEIDGWRELLERHYSEMQQMALVLLKAIAIALDAGEDFFTPKFAEPLSVFRMIHYPALPEEKGRVVCGSHTDYGIVTILYQDGAGGLQVRNLQDEWMDAPAIPGSFVVNIGDMMSMWSNNRYKSTAHHVVNPGVERISMPFFCEPNPDTVIECLPNCHDEKNPPKYAPVRASDWMQLRFKQTYAYRAGM